MKQCHSKRDNHLHVLTLSEIVSDFLRNYEEDQSRYLRFYRIQKSLSDAITKAALAQLPDGSRFSHQRRIPGAVLAQVRDILLRLDYKDISTFSGLYDKVATAIRPIPGVGPLTTYDTAHRLGAYLGLQPEHVYIHAGALTGAKALGVDTRANLVPSSVFPPELRRLRPEQIEDCLCIYKRQFQAWQRVHSERRPRS